MTIKLLRHLRSAASSEDGSTTVEYALILGFIVLVVIVAINAVAGETTGMWNDIATKNADATAGR